MSKQEYRKCVPPCPRYITGSDTHNLCVFCLGLEHAQAAFKKADCPHCESFPMKTFRSRLALFDADGNPATAACISGPASIEAACRLRSLGLHQQLVDEVCETDVSLSCFHSTGSEELDDELVLSVSDDQADVVGGQSSSSSVAYEDLIKVITRAVAKLSLDWPDEQQQVVQSKLDDCFYTTYPVQPLRRNLPFFPDLHDELSKTWMNPYSACVLSPETSMYSSIVGLQEHGYGGMPKVEEPLACLLSPSTASSWRKPTLPSRMCRSTSSLVGKAYAEAGQAGASLHTMALLQVYQAVLLKELDQGGSFDQEAVQELRRATDLSLRTIKQTAHAIGRSMAALVVTERLLWLDMTGIRGGDKAFLLDAPIAPQSLFGDAHNVVIDRLLEARKQSEALKQFMPYQNQTSAASGSFPWASTSGHMQQQKVSVAARAPPPKVSGTRPHQQAHQSKRRSDLRTVIASKAAKKNI